MQRLTLGLVILFASAAMAGCGTMLPMPVPSTPTIAAESPSAPLRQPPHRSAVSEATETTGVCSHQDLGNVATFQGHYNASDGNHYHGWEPPRGKTFWVIC